MTAKRPFFFVIILFIGILSNLFFDCGMKAYSGNSGALGTKTGMSILSSNQIIPQFLRNLPIFSTRHLPRHLQESGFEIGLLAGTSHSLTNIGTGMPSFLGAHWEATDLNAGVFGRYRINNLMAINSSFHYVRINSADSLLSDPNISRYKRDFYFNNTIYELGFNLELYLPGLFVNPQLEIFGFLGLAVFYHDPELTVPEPGKFEEPSFSNIQPAIPMGFGFVYSIGQNFKIGIDIGHRITFTEYLAGFTRPASDANDSYYLGSFRVSYLFGAKRFRPY